MQPTAEEVRGFVHYEPITGVFTRDGKAVAQPTKSGRCYLTIKGKLYPASRVAWLYMTGEWPTVFVDHRDCNPSNNKFNNLRLATRSENMTNRGANKNNQTGAKGVSECRDRHGNYVYKARIMKDGKSYRLGKFETVELAMNAYEAAAIKLHGRFARTL